MVPDTLYGIDISDVAIIGILLLGTVTYWFRDSLKARILKPTTKSKLEVFNDNEDSGRDFVKKMEELGKNCIVFYGSQTGTAEGYAKRLAKEGRARFGLDTMVADLDEYDFENLDEVPSSHVVMFVLATAGEGDPTDNAEDFLQYISSDDVNYTLGHNPLLSNLRFATFGLGNRTYQHYNKMAKEVSRILSSQGAHLVGEVGNGDDAGCMEEDFMRWKEPMWEKLTSEMALTERETLLYDPVFNITSDNSKNKDSSDVFVGELNKGYLHGIAKGPFHSTNPYLSPIAHAKELFKGPDRNCIHMEFDIEGTNLKYETGDHIAVWPINPDTEVDAFLDVLGLTAKRHEVISLSSTDPSAKVPIPTPTTYDTIARYYLEICAPVSREFLAMLAPYSPDESTKQEVTRLGKDRNYFSQHVSLRCLNIASALRSVSRGQRWTGIPFSAFVESINRLAPRYYSISSSSLEQPGRVSVTVAVESRSVKSREDKFYGVASNYLLSLERFQNGGKAVAAPSYDIKGPRCMYKGSVVPVHIRHSNFRLPSDTTKPVVMVGPGTGVAPFRGFIRERKKQVEMGLPVGKTLLFFGCRTRAEDFVYEDEWKDVQATMGNKFEVVTAFSREGNEKVYVQHRLQEKAAEIRTLLKEGAHFYVCGDAANMARSVNVALTEIIGAQRGVSMAQAEEIVKQMKLSNQYQVCLSII
ncbi:unnamed protein product [Clonostachys rosea f. rosea IK726]|uniref:Uncharacterized protein n=1 Tax=Clonostachys rosea f. rosea IK726 TaxID=1349383 RepID=A0ACA9UK46_BIOOC|nr:unnamed protein product [Clonostachys rosea f. rosea IK726]